MHQMWRRRKPIDDSERVVTDVERATKRTMDRAVKLLAAKPRAVGELRERLLEKSWTNAEIVDGVIEKLKEYNYLDDEQYARDLALSKLRQKPQGRRKLIHALSQKSLSKETIEASVREAYEKLPEETLIDDAIETRIASRGEPKTRQDKEKLYSYLMRRGFAYDLIIARLRDRRDGTPTRPED
jgi:regulatory protein